MASGRDRFQLPPQVACGSPMWKYTQENVVTLKMRPPQNAFTSLDTFMAAHSPRRFCQTRQKYVLKPLALERKIPDSRFVPTYEKARPESGNTSFRPGPKLPFTFKRSESIPNTPRDASDLIAIGTIPITTQKQAQPKPIPRSPCDEDNSPMNLTSKQQDDEKLKPEAIWKAKSTLNLKGNKYPDPMVGASPSLQGRIAEMAQLELDTIRYEKSKRIRKKVPNS